MIFEFILLGLVISILVFLIAASIYAYFIQVVDSKFVQVTFKEFISLYSLCPNKYSFEKDYNDNYHIYYSPDFHTTIHIDFKTARDSAKFTKWRIKKEKYLQEVGKNNTAEELIKYWQKDIEEFKTKSQHEIKEKLEDLIVDAFVKEMFDDKK